MVIARIVVVLNPARPMVQIGLENAVAHQQQNSNINFANITGQITARIGMKRILQRTVKDIV